MQGYLSIILHSHLPFVRHPEYSEFLEEDWFFEGVAETYLQLLAAFSRLLNDGVRFRISMVISPTLAAMMNDDLLRDRCAKYIAKRIELCEKEVWRTRDDWNFNPLARFYLERYRRLSYLYNDLYRRDLVGAFREVYVTGNVELLTCAATHGFLPLMQTQRECVRAQVELGCREFERNFGRRPTGIWLPECAYYHGLEEILAESELRYFILDTHGVLFASPRPVYGVYAPLYTPSGVAVFGRDPESSKQVWSSKEGYPGDAYYRDFYRDAGFDLDFDYIKEYIQPSGQRKFTGIKYYRITGDSDFKLPYIPSAARERVEVHAGNFVFNRSKQIEYLHSSLGIKPFVTSPYDAELFGHWWFEGVDFLEMVMRKACYDQRVFEMATPSEFLKTNPSLQVSLPAQSSWGDKGNFEVWLNSSNEWVYPHLDLCAGKMVELARRFRGASGIDRRCLNQAARELLLAQSSDWAFIMTTRTSVDYAVKRTKRHILRFLKLAEMLDNSWIDEGYLSRVESQDNIFPEIDFELYC